MQTVIKNANYFDTTNLSFAGDSTIVIEDGIILSVGETAIGSADAVIDAANQFVLPGLIDAHVHFRLATLNFRRLAELSEVEFGIMMARLATETVHRGFTTVRDLCGEVDSLMRAIRTGLVVGPRIVRAGLSITQTGGHGDAESGRRPVPQWACSMRHNSFGIVADGVEAVRKAARHVLREGSDFIKIHVSGGVASPNDPLEAIQYTPEEITTVVREAQNRHTYVAAHAYSPASIAMAVENGVHSIEHGNLIDAKAAAALVDHGAVLVPTLVTYFGMREAGAKFGLPATNALKNQKVLEAGLASLEIAKSAGVSIGFGTDLIGELQNLQNREFAIRSEVQSAHEILHAMYVVNPKLCRLEGKVGVIKSGAFADLVISKANPLDDIKVLADPRINFSAIIKGGVRIL
jgi:imidazolonepropionase-like amidohydrolase